MKKLISTTLALAVALVFAVNAFALQTFTVPMSGKAETPKGDPDGTGSATVTLNGSKGQICFNLKWSKIDAPVAAHIHKGKKGVAGPVVVPFFGGAAKHKGCVKAARKLIGQISKSPKSYYVNIHTQKYPAGALRAQL